MSLKHFSPSELLLDRAEAARVIGFFWPDQSVSAPNFTTEDRAFAQALLVEAIERSYDLSYVELLFKSFYMKVPASFDSVRKMVQKFAREALKIWFKHATPADLLHPEIYESVRSTLSLRFKSVWKIREQTDELTY